MPRATLYTGDALTVLRTLPDGAARSCVTSPPYWGLRDYGHADQIGLERTPVEFVDRIVEVFREVRRVLTDDGTLWLNLGDSYCNAGQSRNGEGLDGIQRGGAKGDALGYKMRDPRHALRDYGIKHKDLVGIPWMVAFALRADGWYLRSDIIWAKPNPMPESVTDRPTKSHEYVFLLSKRAKYFYDAQAIAEESLGLPAPTWDERKALGEGPRRAFSQNAPHGCHRVGGGATRNARSVWSIATTPYPGAHFATFPPELAQRCILAGSSQRGGCPECGKPWERQLERTPMVIARSERTHEKGRTRSSGTMLEPPTAETVGWAPTCDHGLEPVPDTVLDPFSGSGTTAATAVGHGRNAIGIELNPKYQELARHRIGPMLCEVMPCAA